MHKVYELPTEDISIYLKCFYAFSVFAEEAYFFSLASAFINLIGGESFAKREGFRIKETAGGCS